jgi:dUTP pyrophosphatase
MSPDSQLKAPTVRMMRLPHGEGLPEPSYQTEGAAGVDLPAAIADHAQLIIEPGAWELVPTGFALELPLGWEAQVRPRSGLARKFGVTVLNAPGTIDSDYRGEIGVILINHGPRPFEIARGQRIAQLVFAPAPQARLLIAAGLSGTTRGEGGYGSTG